MMAEYLFSKINDTHWTTDLGISENIVTQGKFLETDTWEYHIKVAEKQNKVKI